MKQRLVEQAITYLRPLPKDERIIAVMDIVLNMMNNVGFSPIEIAGVGHCIQIELDRELKADKVGVTVLLSGNENLC